MEPSNDGYAALEGGSRFRDRECVLAGLNPLGAVCRRAAHAVSPSGAGPHPSPTDCGQDVRNAIAAEVNRIRRAVIVLWKGSCSLPHHGLRRDLLAIEMRRVNPAEALMKASLERCWLAALCINRLHNRNTPRIFAAKKSEI